MFEPIHIHEPLRPIIGEMVYTGSYEKVVAKALLLFLKTFEQMAIYPR